MSIILDNDKIFAINYKYENFKLIINLFHNYNFTYFKILDYENFKENTSIILPIYDGISEDSSIVFKIFTNYISDKEKYNKCNYAYLYTLIAFLFINND